MYRVSWVKWMGVKYQPKEFVVQGWQENDLPIFGKILDVFVCKAQVYYKILEYKTLGISRHFHSFVIEKTTNEKFTRNLMEYTPVRAVINDQVLYVTLRTHIENN